MNIWDRILRKRKGLNEAQKDAIWRADSIPFTDKAICRTCGKILSRNDRWEGGHEQSVHNFGSNNLSNLSVQCFACNRSLGAKNMKMINRISLHTWLVLYSVAVVLSIIGAIILSV